MSDPTKADPNRRQFIGMLGAGAAVSAGLSGTAGTQEVPIVSMENDRFDPIGLYVETGTTVRFEIGSGSHSATAYENRIPGEASVFDSGVISEGGFEYTFDTPGTYDYYCRPHQSMGMVGRVVVGEPGGPAEASSIPDGDVPDSETIVDQRSISIEEFAESGNSSDGEMRGKSPGMMNRGDPGWMVLVPLGFLTAVLGVASGVVYWAVRRGDS